MDNSTSDRAPPPTPHTIVIVRREPFGFGWDVAVNPPQTVGHDREFRTLPEARRYARYLASSMDWGIADLSGEPGGE
jgi:hypothetical protein